MDIHDDDNDDDNGDDNDDDNNDDNDDDDDFLYSLQWRPINCTAWTQRFCDLCPCMLIINIFIIIKSETVESIALLR